MAADIRVSHEALVGAIKSVLAAEDMPVHVREVEAEVMAEADLLGVPSHGVRMLPGLVKALREGRVSRDPQLKVIRERGASCLMDCDVGPGRYTSAEAMRIAVGRAKTYGIGICLAARTSHWGRAHAYACRAAQAGMIGICSTNAMSSMFVPGSSSSVLGNNPLAVSAPRGPGRDPIVLDMAMTQAAVGKIGTYLREGLEVPLGWGLDSAGNPTHDPAAILASRKFLPVGGIKGYGLCLMLELMTAGLTGGLLGCEILETDRSTLDPGSSKIFVAVDVGAFIDPQVFHRRAEDLLARLREAAEPGHDMLYPGERGWRTRDLYLAEGIPIHPEIASQLSDIGVKLVPG